MGALDGQVALVTGAARGIGRGLAERFLAEGAVVAITDREDAVLDVATEIGASGFVGDVADESHVRSVVDAVMASHGRIDVLVSNAGEVRPTNVLSGLDGASEAFDRLFGSNAKGAFLFGRAVAPHMVTAGSGNIINISTDHVLPGPGCDRHHGHGSMDLYNASKWALNGLTFDWAKTLRPHGIRVNNLCMGATDTPMLRGYLRGEPDPAYLATWITPAQIAQVVMDLLAEGPNGRSADSVGLYAGQPCVLPPPL
jgi:3-oxoacyl-[acyl-carrier protein] reductase